MPSGYSKTTSKRGSSKKAEIEEMASAVLGNENSLSRALAQEELENIVMVDYRKDIVITAKVAVVCLYMECVGLQKVRITR